MYLENHFPDARAKVLLAHGAGAPMDSPFMERIARGLQEYKITVVRFEFPYMRERRVSGKKRPPDRAEILLDCWRQVIAEQRSDLPMFIAGKSMGGRMATMIACEELPVQGVMALGYPFHPPGKPDRLRIEHLASLRCPALVVQGERDPFGKREEVESYPLPDRLHVHWIDQGNHDLEPPRRSGLTQEENLNVAIQACSDFITQCMPGKMPG